MIDELLEKLLRLNLIFDICTSDFLFLLLQSFFQVLNLLSKSLRLFAKLVHFRLVAEDCKVWFSLFVHLCHCLRIILQTSIFGGEVAFFAHYALSNMDRHSASCAS